MMDADTLANTTAAERADPSLEVKQSDEGAQTPPPPPKQENTSTTSKSSKDQSNKSMSNSSHEAAISPEVWAFVISNLAHQLEYYLSVQNLSRDTYVETLRGLNDGCVPVPILANFTKVKHILLSVGIIDEARRMEAVWEAATKHSTKLRGTTIDTKTGKQLRNDEDKDAAVNTILAIGTEDGDPIAMLDAPPVVPTSEFANALVLRDVAPEVTIEEIHSLFNFEGCPPVISITPDVANCWFVQLETTDRSDVMTVLLQLRGETLGGFPVHARIKSSVASSTVPIDPAPLMVSADWQVDPQMLRQQQSGKNQPHSPGRRKKKNNRANKKKKNSSNSNGSNNNNNGSNNNNNNGSSKKGNASSPESTPQKKKTTVPRPPSLGEEDFPTLVDNRVEWDTTPVQDEEKSAKETNSTASIEGKDDKTEGDEDCGIKSVKIGSDSASTATTASSSTEPGPKKVGYAAALKTNASSMSSSSSSTGSPPAKAMKVTDPTDVPPSPKVVTKTKDIDESPVVPTSPVVVRPPSWGGGRSFADILRHAQTAS